jgi:hypothetical protein
MTTAEPEEGDWMENGNGATLSVTVLEGCRSLNESAHTYTVLYCVVRIDRRPPLLHLHVALITSSDVGPTHMSPPDAIPAGLPVTPRPRVERNSGLTRVDCKSPGKYLTSAETPIGNT